MYGPRFGRLHTIAWLLVVPPRSVTSPRAPGRMTKIGASGARPLATTSSPPPKIGVGAVIFELPPSRHSSYPERGSYPRMKLAALVTSSGPAGVAATVG